MGQGSPAAGLDQALLVMPQLEPADLDGGKLRVVATTSIIGDVVARVGGEAIELQQLMEPGQDPHSYQPSAGDLTGAAQAGVIFINGWDLEEGLANDLATVAAGTPLIPVSAGIKPLAFTSRDEDEPGRHKVDPHVWLDPHLVKSWTSNIARALVELDPANALVYEANAAAYLSELDQLIAYVDEQLAAIPEAQRTLVTSHDSFGYFAGRYGFNVVGTVLPSGSTLAEPSASQLAELVGVMEAVGVCTIFSETTANEELAIAVAAELNSCQEVKVVPLYTGALGPAGSHAGSYIDMMKVNVDTIVANLAQGGSNQ